MSAVTTPRAGQDVATRRHTLFALGWGLAALFHLAGNPRPPFAPAMPEHVVVQAALGLTALVVCLAPRRRLPLLLLCALVPVSAWLEAPEVGNHWVLAAALSTAYLLAWAVSLSGARRDRGADGVWHRFAPTARWALLAAYAFAAFAKLNTGFLDPVTSCAVYYQDQIARSWGLGGLSVVGHPALAAAVPVGAALVELAVTVLLVPRRTRRLGLLLALAFHWSLALDLAQHFWDFSSVLFAGFLLFADDAHVDHVGRALARLRDGTRPSVRWVVVTIGALAAAVVTAAGASSGPGALHGAAIVLGHAGWAVIGTGTVVLVALATLRTRAMSRRGALVIPSPVLLLVPALVVLNGLTPYLELKTGYGWTMYSNLRTVAGQTNHLLLPATLDLTGAQADVVEVLATSDPGLEPLVGSQRGVVFSELLEYAAGHPEQSLTYSRAGGTVVADPIGAEPALQAQVSVVSERVQSFRVVDLSGAERCLSGYGPAR